MDQVEEAAGGIRGVRVLDERGGFSGPCDVRWERGRFAAIDVSGSEPAEPRWLIPGLVDAHLHAAWHRFDAPDRADEDPDLVERETRRALRATLRAGVTSVRDAGGLRTERSSGRPTGAAPRVQTSVSMLDRAAVDRAGGMARAVAGVLEAGAQWIKLVATASVMSPPGARLEPAFERAEIAEAVRAGAAVGAEVMVHAWGGPAIDDAIEVGTASIEHGIFLTDAQARRAAEHGLTLVPTLRIYRLVQAMIASGELPAALRRRVDEAVGAHPEAVRRARDAGLRIALGTDYGTREQHGTNRLEFDALVSVGLTPAEALVAATRSGAELLRRVDPGAPSGRIAVGEIADALILTRDPSAPGALSGPDAIAAIVLGGAVIVPDPPQTASSRTPEPSID